MTALSHTGSHSSIAWFKRNDAASALTCVVSTLIILEIWSTQTARIKHLESVHLPIIHTVEFSGHVLNCQNTLWVSSIPDITLFCAIPLVLTAQ